MAHGLGVGLGGSWPGGGGQTGKLLTPTPVNRITHTTENITHHAPYVVGKKEVGRDVSW